MTRGRSLRDNHDEATIAQAEDGRWSFACRCGFAQNCGSFDAAQFLALNHGVGRRPGIRRLLKIALVLLNRLGGHIKHVRRKLVHLLPPHVGHVVLGQFRRGQHKGLDVAHVVQVLLAQHDAPQRVRRRSDLFKAFAIWRENDVADHAVFAVWPPVIVNRLDGKSLRVGVVVPLDSEFGFALCKALDDLRHGLGGRVIGDGIVARRMQPLGWFGSSGRARKGDDRGGARSRHWSRS